MINLTDTEGPWHGCFEVVVGGQVFRLIGVYTS